MTHPELRVGSARTTFPFSRGLLVESLVNAGASAPVASAVSRRVEQQLRLARRTVVSPAELKALMVEVARDVAGDEIAQAAQAQTPAFQDILVTAKKGDLPFSRGCWPARWRTRACRARTPTRRRASWTCGCASRA
ncbi:hypothetical protein [Deinococcus actinosclerus]|uniref:hypothetical protein n=1 Tax=Deinococcus actinosclerus TaxID=1768108 RepID=UPI002FF4F5C6